MESEERRESVVKRVRSVLKLASNKGCGQHESPKERARKETEFFKKLFMQCDINGSGTLTRSDVIRMARKHLKIAERLVPDADLMQFFSAIDADGGGEIDFTEFLSFIRTPEDHSHLNEVILRQVKRAVRLSIRRQNITIQELEFRFHNSAQEGIIETVNPDGSLGPEEMRRFFRKVLDVNVHETPDKNLAVAFKVMDEDCNGTFDANEFMNWIRSAITEETALCPSPVRDPNRRQVPDVLAGMNGAVPARCAKHRPGTTSVGGACGLPFCLSGRDLEPKMRAAVSTPCLLQEPRWRPLRGQAPVTSNLLPCGLPKTPSSTAPILPCFARTAPGFSRDGSPMSPKPRSASASLSPQKEASKLSKIEDEQEGAERGAYTGNTSSLNTRDARVLNRIEGRICGAGVDVRGWYHKRC